MKEYHNLTQTEGHRNCYFRSTDIEQKNWKRILWSVPDEMLYFLSKNEEIMIIDKSTKDRNKVARVLVPVLTDLLNWLYFRAEPKHKQLKHHFSIAKKHLRSDSSLLTKFKFWKKRISNVRIYTKTIKVKKELGLE